MSVMLDTLKELAKLISQQKKQAAGTLFKKGTGNLKRSIKEKVIGDDSKGYQIQSSMVDYGYYQDSGVKGRGDKKFRNTVRANDNSLFEPGQFSDSHYVIGGPLPFAARYVIRRRGIKPKPFIKPSVLDVMQSKGNQMIADATAEDVAIQMTNSFKNAKLQG